MEKLTEKNSGSDGYATVGVGYDFNQSLKNNYRKNVLSMTNMYNERKSWRSNCPINIDPTCQNPVRVIIDFV